MSKVDVPHDVQEAIRTLIRWAGDDPEREGLLDRADALVWALTALMLGPSHEGPRIRQL